MESALKRDLRNYPLYFLIWTIIGISFSARPSHKNSSRVTPHRCRTALSHGWLEAYLWALLMPEILWLGRRFPIERRGFGGPAQPTIHGQSGCRTWIRDRAS